MGFVAAPEHVVELLFLGVESERPVANLGPGAPAHAGVVPLFFTRPPNRTCRAPLALHLLRQQGDRHPGFGLASLTIPEFAYTCARWEALESVALDAAPLDVAHIEAMRVSGGIGISSWFMRRRAVRVVVVDERENVLLLWHEWPHGDPHWAPPGGGVEDDESPESAAARELVEEVGLTGVVLGQPVWRWCHNFAFDGEPVEQDELIYVSRVEQTLVQGSAAHLAADGVVDAQWWSLPDLEQCTDEVWPPELARRVADVLRGRLDMARIHLIIQQ